MNILEKKPIMMVFVAICLFLGVFLGTHRALSSRYDKAVDVFYHGVDGDGVCIYGDIADRIEYAKNIVSMSTKYDINASHLSLAISEVENQEDINDIKEANEKLQTEFLAVYSLLVEENLSDQDSRFLNQYYKSFKSRVESISHDPYHDYASSYNKALEDSLLGRLFFHEELVYFR